MKKSVVKLKRGGLDTIVAYIVVMLPLLYVLVYMVATIYHFSVQSYMNQVVKEATVMASTYGAVTTGHEKYITDKLSDVLGVDEDNKTKCTIEYYIRRFSEDGVVGNLEGPYNSPNALNAKKADIIGIYVQSTNNSLLESVTAFNALGSSSSSQNPNALKYTSYREEIIRNERPT